MPSASYRLTRMRVMRELKESRLMRKQAEKLATIRELLMNTSLPPGEALDEVLSIIDGEALG